MAEKVLERNSVLKGKHGKEPEEGTRIALWIKELLDPPQRRTAEDTAVMGRQTAGNRPSPHGPPAVPEHSFNSTAQAQRAGNTNRDSKSPGLQK